MESSRSEMLNDLLDYVGHAGDEGARSTMARIFNRVLERIWMHRPWSCLLQPMPYQLTTNNTTVLYPLPGNFGRITGIDGQLRNLTTLRWIRPTTRPTLEQRVPGLDTSVELAGQPILYELAGTMPVNVQPATTGQALEVVSDNAADTTVVVEIEGFQIANGVTSWTQTQVTLTGTAAVALGTWTEIDAFGKAYPDGATIPTDLTSSVGNVILRLAGAGAELQRLLPQESAREVRVLRFYPKPDGPYVITVPYLRNLQRVYRDAAPLPEHWDVATFEGCVLAWNSQAGITPGEPPAIWPALTELVILENSMAAQMQRHRVPFR